MLFKERLKLNMIPSKLKLYEVNKLFYNRFAYSLTLLNKLTCIFRNKNFKYAGSTLDKIQAQYEQGEQLLFTTQLRQTSISESHFLDAKTVYNELTRNRDDYLIRCEGNTLNIYTNDKKWLISFGNKLKNATSWHQPKEKYIQFLKENTNTIIVNTDFPYNFKVTFNNSTVNPTLADWLQNNSDKVKSSRLLQEDIRKSGYINGRYVFCTSENVVMLLKIIAGDSIQKIDKLVHKQNIDK